MHSDLEQAYFARGREILGKNAGGLLATLLKCRNQDVEAAGKVLEAAADKLDPREYVAAACQYRPNAKPAQIVSSTLRQKLEIAKTCGRFYAHASSRQWQAWDKYLQAQGKPGAIRDRDGGWWFATEWPPVSAEATTRQDRSGRSGHGVPGRPWRRGVWAGEELEKPRPPRCGDLGRVR